MADLIDRDAAYDAIGFERCDRSCADCPTKCTWFYTVNKIPAVNRWIPCSERLPEDGERVLIAHDSGAVYIAERDGKCWKEDSGKWYSEVSHWMPLPETPKGGAGNAVSGEQRRMAAKAEHV